jgi:cyclic-di-GMP phosphodiesterase TipF (flagellum assembly factor)
MSSLMILVAMIVTAGSVAIVLDIRFGLPLSEAAVLGLGMLLVMVLVQQYVERQRDRDWLDLRIQEIGAVAGDGQAEIAKLAGRLNRLEQALPQRVREETEPLSAEVEVIGQLLKQVAETLAELEAKVDRQRSDMDARTAAVASRQAAATADAFSVAPPRTMRSRVAAEPAVAEPTSLFVSEAPDVPGPVAREIEQLIRQEAIEIHLQPIVTLPQRKVRYYEVLTRLKGRDRLIEAAEFIPVAEDRRLIAKVDTYQVIRAFQVLKRLTQRNGEIGLFVNLSVESLASNAFFRDFQAFLAQNRGMADLVQFEFRQDAVQGMGPLETESLKAVADLGYRFSVDNVTDFRSDFRRLADIGFRSAKVSAERLLGRQPVSVGDIHIEDMAGHLLRQGITLVADRVELETQVVDLLDFEVHYAQGFLFSAPRQVRPEVLASGAAAGSAGNGRAQATGGR